MQVSGSLSSSTDSISGGALGVGVGSGGMNHITSYIDTILASSTSSSEGNLQQAHLNVHQPQHPTFASTAPQSSSFVSSSFGMMPPPTTNQGISTTQSIGLANRQGVVSSSLMPQSTLLPQSQSQQIGNPFLQIEPLLNGGGVGGGEGGGGGQQPVRSSLLKW
jgi:hypothetical protein